MRMRNLLLWTAAAAWMASCDPALAATYRLDLDWKTLAFTDRPALGELATVEVLNIGESDPTNLTLYLSNRGGSMLAITEGMNAISNGATAGLALNTTNLLAEFDSIPPQGSKSFDLSIWDSSRSILLASAPIDVRNNPLWETLSFTNLPAIESLGLSEYLSRANDWTSAMATARYTLDLSWKDLTFDNSMAVAERAVVEIRGIGDAEPTALMLWLSNPQMEGLAVTPMMAASGTNGTAAIGMLNLATTNLLAEFDGRRPDAERRFDLSIWDTQRDVLLGSAAVHIRNNPLARHFVEGWTNVPSAVESQLLASITAVQSNLSAHADDTDNPHGVTAEQLGALTEEEDAAALAAVAAVSGRVDTVEGWGDHAEAGYLEDAPETGGPFARQSNGWVTVTVGSGGLSLEELQALFVSSSNDNFTVENGVGGFRIGFHGTNAFRVLAQTTALARITSFSAGTSNLTFGFESPSGSNILWWTEIITLETVDSFEWSVYTGEVSFSWSSGIGTATVASVDLTEPRLWRIASDGLAVASNAYARFDVPAYVGDERIATMADLSIASAGSLLYASVIASDKVPLDYSVPVTTNEMIPPSEYIPAWSFDLDTGTATVHRLRVGSLADTNGNPISVGDGINSATAGEIATNVLSTATTNDMPGVDWGSLVGGGGTPTTNAFAGLPSILVSADWTWTNSIYAVGADTSSTNISVTLPDAGTNFASVIIRKFSNLNNLEIKRGTNVVYTLYDDGSARAYDWWPQRTNWYWRN